MNIKMIALDLDGTTLTSSREISDRTRRALEEACNRGVHVVVSTGRTYSALPEAVKSVKGIEYAITSNGAHINYIDTGKSIYDSYLSDAAVEKVYELSHSPDTYIEVFVDGQAYMDESVYRDIEQNGCEYRSAEYVLWSRKPIPDAAGLMMENRDRIENINFVFRNTDKLEEYRPVISSIPEAKITSSFSTNLEVGGPNTSKKTALIELMKRLDVRREELMCCGDAPNDIEMIEYAGIGVAVGNAWGGTKDHADYIAPTNDDDGVADAVERFALNV